MSAIRVVVADTARAEIFEMDGAHAPLRKLSTLTNPFAARHERDLGADAPGRVVNRQGGVQHALAPRHLLKQQATEKFARLLAERITEETKRPELTGVMLVIAPRFLALVQSHLPKNAKRRIIGEVKRNLVESRRLELQRRVEAGLAAPSERTGPIRV